MNCCLGLPILYTVNPNVVINKAIKLLLITQVIIYVSNTMFWHYKHMFSLF